jgi:hydrogenase maturation protease
VSEAEKILVMGVGNPLMRDEGAGPRTVELIMNAYEFPPNVEVVDCGTMGYTILDVLRGVDHLIVIDALRDPELEPGTVVRLEPDDFASSQVMHSLHDVRLPEVLQAAALIGHEPKTVAIGIQIESIEEWVLELSQPVAAALPRAVEAVLEELRALGVEAVPATGDSADARIIESVRSRSPLPAELTSPADPPAIP